jgi:transcriptional regulator with PAS, ATPase and Fis domain
MPIGTQAKLLRVLEERKIRRLGGAREIEVDVRIVAATNRDLREGIAKGTFREDLYFRLNVFEVTLPPLRDRREDIPLIARALLDGLNKRHETRVTDLAPDVEALFAGYAWTGNVRELRNVLERAAILAGDGLIRPQHLPPGFAGLPNRQVESSGSEVTLRPGVTVEEAERQLILMTLRHTDGNRARAAELLGLSVKTLFNKLKQYNEPDQ